MPVKVEGLARDWDSFFKLETDLIESQSFGRVLPRGIDKMPNGELSFTLEFAYFPGESLPASEEPLVEEVAQDDAKTPPPDEATDTAVELATGGDAADRADERVVPGKDLEDHAQRLLGNHQFSVFAGEDDIIF